MIAISVALRRAKQSSGDPCAVFWHEDAGPAPASAFTPAERKALAAAAEAEAFKGSAGECLSTSLPVDGGKRRFYLIGLGKKKEVSAASVRKAAGAAYHFAKARAAGLLVLPPQAAGIEPRVFLEGLLLASYRFDEYRKPEPIKLAAITALAGDAAELKRLQAALERASAVAEAICLTRDLVNRCPSDKTPASLGEIAKALVGPKISATVMGVQECQDAGMGSFLGVARGSSVEPAFIHLAYKPRGAKRKVALVGKGIVFDSGGLSLKPPQSMETMKMDMAGAALVLSVFTVAERLKLKIELHGYCPVTYNMPGPDAVKPGDVVRAMNGKTIEVLNTDAEGRLALADALAYANTEKPDAIIDVATLTGAVVTALGSKVTGAMTNSRALLERLKSASQASGEPLWELPLVAEYRDLIKGSIADLQNIGKARGEAGSIIGGLFLKEFADPTPWVHLDIAGTAWTDSDTPTCPKGGTGAMVRTILEYLCRL